MPEKLFPTGIEFGYTEEHVVLGIAGMQENIKRFKEQLNSHDPELRTSAAQNIPLCEEALQYVQGLTPQEILLRLKGIWNKVCALETNGAPSEHIGDMLYRHGPEIIYFRAIFNEGWIEYAFQSYLGARCRADIKRMQETHK